MRWLKPHRTADPGDTGSVEETPAEPVQTVAVDNEGEATEVATVVGKPDRDEQPTGARARIRWARVLAYGVLPGLALLLALAAGYLKWQDSSAREAQVARAASVQSATESTIALLSYKPNVVQKDLEAARSRLTGTFLDAYTQLTRDVVIPEAKEKQISAVANVPAAALVRATTNHAVVLLFVNQTIIIGPDAPTSTASSVRVTLDKTSGRWLISQFDPV